MRLTIRTITLSWGTTQMTTNITRKATLSCNCRFKRNRSLSMYFGFCDMFQCKRGVLADVSYLFGMETGKRYQAITHIWISDPIDSQIGSPGEPIYCTFNVPNFWKQLRTVTNCPRIHNERTPCFIPHFCSNAYTGGKDWTTILGYK